MIKTIFFLVLSIPILILSWRSIFSFKNHGFYRFIAWECILWLFLSNVIYWYKDWYTIPQIISWIFLFYSLYLIIFGVIKMKNSVGKDQNRDSSLYKFEKTSYLIESGIFKYIRHPLYGSLLFLTWGIFFKNMDSILFFVSLISSVALFATAIIEEKENIQYFGDSYRHYIKRTKMFIPFLL